MDNDCRDCVYIKNLESRAEKTEAVNANFEERITALERRQDSEMEKTKMIYETVVEIKQSLKELNHTYQIGLEKISGRVDKLEKKPSELSWALGGGALLFLIQKLLEVMGG